MSEIDDVINMIDRKMNSGVSRLKVGFTEELQEGEKKERKMMKNKRKRWHPPTLSLWNSD